MGTQRLTRVLLGGIFGCCAGSLVIALGASDAVGLVVLAAVLVVTLMSAGWSPKDTGGRIAHQASAAIATPEGPRTIRITTRVALVTIAAVFASAFAAYIVKGSPTAIIPAAIKDFTAPASPTTTPTLEPGEPTRTPSETPTPDEETTPDAADPTTPSTPDRDPSTPEPDPTKPGPTKPGPTKPPKPGPTEPSPSPSPTEDDPDGGIIDDLIGILDPDPGP